MHITNLNDKKVGAFIHLNGNWRELKRNHLVERFYTSDLSQGISFFIVIWAVTIFALPTYAILKLAHMLSDAAKED